MFNMALISLSWFQFVNRHGKSMQLQRYFKFIWFATFLDLIKMSANQLYASYNEHLAPSLCDLCTCAIHDDLTT